MQNRKKVKKRNIVLKIETYERLEKYKVRLISEKGDSRLTFDDAVNTLLDNAEQRKNQPKRIRSPSHP